jgi:hypothetical protein
VPKWLDYDSDSDALEAGYSKRTRSNRPGKASRFGEEPPPRKAMRKRHTPRVEAYDQNWIPVVGPARQRRAATVR